MPELQHLLLFFSRGKGRGHAIPDAAIADDLAGLDPSLRVKFVSYSTGADTLRCLGRDVVDVDLPEENSPWDLLSRIVPIVYAERPRLIVSHEEFCVLPLARAFGIRSAFLTDWFARPDSVNMQALRYADRIVFLDDPGFYDEPSYVAGKVNYTGCVLRRLDCEGLDRGHCRLALKIPFNSTVLLVSPGGAEMHSEARAPLFDLVVGAFDLLQIEEKRLLWVVADPDYTVLSGRAHRRGDIVILKPHFNFTPTLMASDIIITKGNRLPLLECEELGIPSISISFGYNLVDDHRAARIPTNTALRARGLNHSTLKDYIIRSLKRTEEIRRVPKSAVPAARLAVAQLLRSMIA